MQTAGIQIEKQSSPCLQVFRLLQAACSAILSKICCSLGLAVYAQPRGPGSPLARTLCNLQCTFTYYRCMQSKGPGLSACSHRSPFTLALELRLLFGCLCMHARGIRCIMSLGSVNHQDISVRESFCCEGAA
jgi:hypothetical protein